MAKHPPTTRNLKTGTACIPAPSLTVFRGSRKQALGQTLSLARSHDLKEKRIQNISHVIQQPDVECNVSDGKVPGPCDDWDKHMSSALTSMLGDRVMQLKLWRVSHESPSETLRDPASVPSHAKPPHTKPARVRYHRFQASHGLDDASVLVPSEIASTLQTSESVVERPLKRKANSGASPVPSSVKSFDCQREQRTRRGIRSMLRKRVVVSKKCNIGSRRRSSIALAISKTKKAVDVATSSALLQPSSQSTAHRLLKRVSPATVRRPGQPKKHVASRGKHEKPSSDPVHPLNHEILSPQHGLGGLKVSSINHPDTFSISVAAEKYPVLSERPGEVSCDRPFQAKHVNKRPRPSAQRPCQRGNHSDLKEKPLGQRRVGRPTKRAVPEATPSEDTVGSSEVVEPPTAQGQTSNSSQANTQGRVAGLGFDHASINDDREQKYPVFSVQPGKVARDKSFQAKCVNGKSPRPSAQRPFQRRNRSDLKENRLSQTKKLVGRPKKRIVPEGASSEDTVGSSEVVEPPTAQSQTSNSSQANAQGCVADMGLTHFPRNADEEKDAVFSEQPISCKLSFQTTKINGKMTRRSTQRPLQRKTRSNSKENRLGHAKKRVGRSKKRAVPLTTSTEDTVGSAEVVEPPVAQCQTMNFSQVNTQGRVAGTGFDQPSRDEDVQKDHVFSERSGEVSCDRPFQVKHVNKRPRPSAQRPCQRGNHSDLKEKPLGQRRVGRPTKRAVPEATPSEDTVGSSEVVEPPTAQGQTSNSSQANTQGRVAGLGFDHASINDDREQKYPVFSVQPGKVARDKSFQAKCVNGKSPRPSAQRPFQRRKRSDLKENRLSQTKKLVGRPKKRIVPEGASSEDTVGSSEVVEPPTAQSQTSNSSQANAQGCVADMGLTHFPRNADEEKDAVFSEQPISCKLSFQTTKINGKMTRRSTQRPLQRKTRSNSKENRLGHAKKRVGRSKKRAVPLTTSSEDTVGSAEVVEPPVAQCQTMNFSQVNTQGRVAGTGFDQPSRDEDVVQKDPVFSERSGEVSCDRPFQVKHVNKRPRPSAQRPCQRGNHSDLKEKPLGQRRVGRPTKRAVPEATPSEDTVGSSEVVKPPTAQSETSNSSQANTQGCAADTGLTHLPRNADGEKDAVFSEQPVSCELSFQARKINSKMARPSTKRPLQRTTRSNLIENRLGHAKKRVGRSQKRAVPLATPSESTMDSAEVVEPPAAQCQTTNFSKVSTQGRVGKGFQAKRVNGKAPQRLFLRPFERKNRSDLRNDRRGQMKRRVGRPKKLSAPEATSSGNSVGSAENVEPPEELGQTSNPLPSNTQGCAVCTVLNCSSRNEKGEKKVHALSKQPGEEACDRALKAMLGNGKTSLPSDQRPFHGCKRIDLKEIWLCQAKRLFGPLRKHAVPETMSSEHVEQVESPGVVKPPAAHGQTSNSAQSITLGHVAGTGLNHRSSNEDQKNEDSIFSEQPKEVSCTLSFKAKQVNGKAPRPSTQRPFQRRNRSSLKANPHGQTKRRVGRPKKRAVPEVTSSEETAGSAEVEPPVAQGQISNFSHANTQGRIAGTGFDNPSRNENGDKDPVFSEQPREEACDRTVQAKYAYGKTPRSPTQRPLHQNSRSDPGKQLGKTKKRVGRPRKDVPEPTLSGDTVGLAAVVEPSAGQGQTSNSSQANTEGRVAGAGFEQPPRNEDREQKCPSASKQPGELACDKSSQAKCVNGKAPQPSVQRPFERRNRSNLIENRLSQTKGRVGRPKKRAVLDTTSSEDAVGSAGLVKLPAAHGQTLKSSQSNTQGRVAGTGLTHPSSNKDGTNKDAIFSEEPREVSCELSFQAKQINRKTPRQATQRSFQRRNRSNLKETRLGLKKKRVGRPRKRAVSEVTSSEDAVGPAEVVELAATEGQTSNSLQINSRGRVFGPAFYHPSRNEDVEKDIVFSEQPGEMACSRTTQAKHVNGKAQRPFQRSNRSDPKEKPLGKTKRGVGRPRKCGVLKDTSKDALDSDGAVEPPSALCQASNSSQFDTQGRVAVTGCDHASKNEDGKASRMTSSGLRIGSVTSHASMCSADCPIKAEHVCISPLEAEVMTVIYPCEALSVHLPKEAMTSQTRQQNPSQEPKESCHEAPTERHCNGVADSSEDLTTSQKGHSFTPYPSVTQSALPKRRPGRPRNKRRHENVSALDDLSSSPRAASPPINMQHDLPKRRLGRPKKKRVRQKKAETTVGDISSPTKLTSLHDNHDQVVPQQAVNHQTLQQQASTKAKESCFLREQRNSKDISSYSVHESSKQKGHGVSSSPCASQSDLRKRKPGRPRKKARHNAVAAVGDLTSSAKPTSLDVNDEQVVPKQVGASQSTIQQKASLDAKEHHSHVVLKQHPFNEVPSCPETQCTSQIDQDMSSSSSVPLSCQLKRRPGRPKKESRPEGCVTEIPCDKTPPGKSLSDHSIGRDTGARQSGQKVLCSVGNDDDHKQRELRSHAAITRETTGSHSDEAKEPDGRQATKRSVNASSQPSLSTRPDSELKQEETGHQGRVPEDGIRPSPGQQASCLGGRVLQVKLLPLAMVLGLQMASQSPGESHGDGTTLSPSDQEAPLGQRHDVQEISQESAAQQDSPQQVSETETSEAVPSRAGGDQEPSWMGRRPPSPACDFRGFTKDKLYRTHTLDSKVCCSVLLVEDEGLEKSHGETSPATELAAQPTTAGAEPFLCVHCPYESPTREKLEKHVRYRHGHIGRNGKYKCEKCDYSTDLSTQLRRHDVKHTGERPFPCSVCGKRFARTSALNVHMLIHTAEKTFKCETCGNGYRSHSGLKFHKKVHTEGKPYRCKFCAMRFRYQFKLDKHVRKHTGEKPFPCVHCGKCFSNRTDLTSHIRTHTGEKPHRCDICGKAFAIRKNLADHTYIHLEERNFKCDYCEKAFKAKRFLQFHMKIHSGEKRFTCQYCDKAFVRQNNLTYHIRIHTGEKPFSCEVCGKSFIAKNLLKDHFRRHTGEKPFKCETCGFMFRYKGNMQSHVKRFHKDVNKASVPILA